MSEKARNSSPASSDLYRRQVFSHETVYHYIWQEKKELFHRRAIKPLNVCDIDRGVFGKTFGVGIVLQG